MYNGIGLETARGSGTNGYVQRNLSFIRRHKDNVDYKSEEELRKLDSELNRGPSREILDHERKRKVELKCMEMQELMEEQGYSEEEIGNKVSVYRHMLMENLETPGTGAGSTVEKDDAGRPIAKETHQLAEASQARNDQLRAAFGLSEFYKDGSSLDPQRKAKEQAAEALAAATKKYDMLPDESSSSSSSSPSPSPERKNKHKVKRKTHKDKDDEAHGRADKSLASDEQRLKKKRKSSPSHERHQDEKRHRQKDEGEETRPRHSRGERKKRQNSAERKEEHQSLDERPRRDRDSPEMRSRHTHSPDDEEVHRGDRSADRMREEPSRSERQTGREDRRTRHTESDRVQRRHQSARKHSTSPEVSHKTSRQSRSRSPDRQHRGPEQHKGSRSKSTRHHRHNTDELDTVD